MPDQPTVPYGYCHCGCGERTAVATRDDPRWGAVKGEPRRFVHGHRARLDVVQPSGDTALCECGCGRPAPIAKRTDRKRGAVKGRPRRFIQGHSGHKGRVRDLTGAYVIDPDSGCWVWQRSRARGYGTMGSGAGLAHRFFYERERGPVPEGMQLDHLCRNRACVNPAHLEPVTNAENCRRGANAKITHDGARQIRTLDAAGVSSRALAARFGISHSQIRRIVNGKAWKGV